MATAKGKGGSQLRNGDSIIEKDEENQTWRVNISLSHACKFELWNKHLLFLLEKF